MGVLVVMILLFHVVVLSEILHSELAISDSTFNNAFFGSALREWQERIALGSFTTEYKAKIRGEEKRRTTVKAEDLWKQKFYEENWGDM